MKFSVGVEQFLAFDMGVDLCRTDTGVSQQFLNRKQFCIIGQQMCGVRVTQHVWMDPVTNPRVEGTPSKNLIDGSTVQGQSPDGEEDPVIPCGNHRPFLVLIFLQGQSGAVTHGNDAFFGAFAEATQESFTQEQVSWTQTTQLRDTHAGAVEELHHGPIPEWGFAAPLWISGCFDDGFDLFEAECVGESAILAWQQDQVGGVFPDAVLAHQKFEESAQGDEFSLAAVSTDPLFSQGFQIVLQVFPGHLLRETEIVCLAMTGKIDQITAVGAEGVLREAPLDAQVIEPEGDGGGDLPCFTILDRLRGRLTLHRIRPLSGIPWGWRDQGIAGSLGLSPCSE